MIVENLNLEREFSVFFGSQGDLSVVVGSIFSTFFCGSILGSDTKRDILVSVLLENGNLNCATALSARVMGAFEGNQIIGIVNWVKVSFHLVLLSFDFQEFFCRSDSVSFSGSKFLEHRFCFQLLHQGVKCYLGKVGDIQDFHVEISDLLNLVLSKLS